jgi:hypothetical protein
MPVPMMAIPMRSRNRGSGRQCAVGAAPGLAQERAYKTMAARPTATTVPRTNLKFFIRGKERP